MIPQKNQHHVTDAPGETAASLGTPGPRPRAAEVVEWGVAPPEAEESHWEPGE